MKWLGITSAISFGLIIAWFSLATSSEDVYLYLECQNINSERLEILLFDVDHQEIEKLDIQLNTFCNQPGSAIIKGINTKSLSVTVHLYSKEGKLLVTKQGSRENNDIVLDQKGFHLDLILKGNPPDITWNSL